MVYFKFYIFSTTSTHITFIFELFITHIRVPTIHSIYLPYIQYRSLRICAYQGWSNKAGQTRLVKQGWTNKAGQTRLVKQGWTNKAGQTRLVNQGWTNKAGQTRLVNQG
jgi:hypothetical protein